MALQKNSPYLPLFNYHLRRMREKGALQKILLQYKPEAQKCPDTSGRPLGFESCHTAFIPITVGLCLALVLFIIEKKCCCINLEVCKQDKVETACGCIKIIEHLQDQLAKTEQELLTQQAWSDNVSSQVSN